METAGRANQEGRILAGKYRLEKELRSGAMGAVYRAHHRTLDKTVCIKIMHPELAKDREFAMRFHREARAASRFDHPNSILILDYGADADGTLFIAMELVDGRDLFDIIDEAVTSLGGIAAVFPPRRIVDLLSQTLAALAAAHDVGILHRDLKPENIMVASSWDDGERVKVCDFGIAQIDEPLASESSRRLTRRGAILGTPEYMSPEQARGDAVDARSDVYSAGVILYHLLTGQLPFDDESALAIALKQIHETPKAPSELNPLVNPQLEVVCLKAMAKDPADRYATAREMRLALRDAVAIPRSTPLPLLGTMPTVPAPPDSARESRNSLVAVQIEARRPRSMRAFVVGAAVLAMASAGAMWKLRHPPLIATAVAAPAATAAPAPPAPPAPTSPEPVATATATPIATAMATPRKIVVSAPAPKPPPVVTPVVVPAVVEEVAPAPVPAPAPPEPMPAPVASAAPAPAPAPAYSVETAHIDFGAAQTVGATAASIDRALAPVRSRLDACYRAALPRAAVLEGTAMLHLETDDVGTIRQATLTGLLAPELGACISKSVSGRRVANVDTGHASADIPLVYRPR